MIPKIIHICWLSGDPFPKDIADCLVSWKEIIPDYELWLWGKKPVDCLGLNITEKNFDLNSVIWCKQAYESKKYAFAADYIRLYAVYNFGGIYMDSDVMMYKSFNDLLELQYFIGEDFAHYFEPAIFGAEKGCKWVKDVLDRYDGLEFVNKDGSLNMLALPKVFHQRLTTKYKFYLSKSVVDFNADADTMTIFPKEWFNSRNYIKSIKAKGAYCSHRFVGSWLKHKKRVFSWKKIVPDCVVNLVYAFVYNYMDKSSADERIPYMNF